MDVIRVEDTMLEDLNTRDACRQVRDAVEQCLTDREKLVIVRRYGLDGNPPQTQREVASQCGISRSYVSRIEKKHWGSCGRCLRRKSSEACKKIGLLCRFLSSIIESYARQ